MSSIAPNESASSINSKKSRPGRKERQASRSAVGSSGGVPASKAKAFAFGSGGMDDPVPQPGKFPVVFQTGVGEPTRDQEFAYSPQTLTNAFSDLSPRYADNPKFAEFVNVSEQTEEAFRDWLTIVSLLRVAQQTVHAHVNLGLPQGDFAAVSTSEVLIPSALSVVIQQFGEMSIPSTGTRFLLKDYPSAVKHLVWAANRVKEHGEAKDVLSSSWFPLSYNDGVTKLVVANAVAAWFQKHHRVTLEIKNLEDSIISGDLPDGWDVLKHFLGPPRLPTASGVDPRDRFDFLFKKYANADAAKNAFTANGAAGTLTELGLHLSSTAVGTVSWKFNAKQSFSELAEQWARTSAAYAQFFELSSGVANRSAAKGSLAQFAQVTNREGVVILKTTMAVSAPELSLAACFPPTVLVSPEPERRVIVTTSLNVSQRATEFCLKDWRS